jgi:hypothetical protein
MKASLTIIPYHGSCWFPEARVIELQFQASHGLREPFHAACELRSAPMAAAVRPRRVTASREAG